MSDRPLSVHVRAAALLYKKLKLSGLFEDKENQTSARRLRTADLNCIRDLEKYLKVVGSVIPNHPSYRRRRNDADIKELEGRVGEIRSIVKHLSGSSPAKFVDKTKLSADKQSHNSYLKAYLTDANPNGIAKEVPTKEDSSKQRGPVQEARVRAKIAALASRNALNRSKKQNTGASATSTKSDAQMRAQSSIEEIMNEELGNSKRVGMREGSILATPPPEIVSAASTPGMTNISQFLFSSNSKSTVNTSTAWGEQPSVQKPPCKNDARKECPSAQSVQKSTLNVQKSDEKSRGEKVIQEVDFMSVRQEMMHLDRKFTNYWLRTSEGCSAMTELIQSVKDDSQQMHVALANELDQVSSQALSGSSKVEQVEHKLEGLEVKFDAMNNVLSSNLKTLCTIAMSKDENSESKPPTAKVEESGSKDFENGEAEDSGTTEMYDKLAQSVEEKIEKLDSKFSTVVEEWGKKNENQIERMLETKIDQVQSDVDSCLEKTNLGVSHEQLHQLAQSVDEKVGSLEARLGSHLSRTIESLESFKENSFGSQLNSKLVDLKKEILTEISSASKAEVTEDQFLHLTQSVEEKVENLEARLMNEIQQEKRLVEKKEQILGSELDTRFSEWKKDIVRSTVKNEQLLSLRQTVDKDVKNCNTAIRNVEQSLNQRLVETIQESQASVTKTFDEKWMTLKQELVGSTSTQDEYLDIMHKMSEKIKQLDSKYQEVILTSESGFEWIQEKQSKFEQKVQGDLQARLDEIDSKIVQMQSKEAVTKSLEDALQPLDTRVGNAVERVDAFEAANALIEERVDALQSNYNEMSSILQEQVTLNSKSTASDEELKKIQNAQRDLYCGLYCTSKVLKEKILSVESKLEQLKKASSTVQNCSVHDGVTAGQNTLNQLVEDFEKLQKQTDGLEDSLAVRSQEMDSKLLSSISGMKQSIEKQSQNLKKDLQDELSKFQIHERENMKELQMNQLDQIKKHFDKRLMDHKKVFDQKLKAIVDSANASHEGPSTPSKRNVAKIPKTKTPAKSPKRRNTGENETRKLIEMVVKQLETQAEKLAALEGKQQGSGDAALNTEIPSHLSNEAILTKAVDKALSQSKDSKIQTSELTKLLKQHVGVVEGKMGLFEQSIQQLTQSIAVAHAKLAQQDTLVSHEGKASFRSNSKIGLNVKKSPSACKPVGTPSKKYKSSSSIQPRVTHNARANPQRTRSVAFY